MTRERRGAILDTAPDARIEAADPPAGGPLVRWRQIRRIAAIALATVIDYPVIIVGALVLGRSRRRRAAWQHRIFRHWCRWLVRIMGVRVAVKGPVPETPFFLVSNHLSWLDVLVLGRVAGGTFVARADLDGWPLVGAICRSGDTIFIDRASKRDLLRVAGEVASRLADGAGIVVFAEGTTGTGDGLLPFKPSILEVAAQSGAAVHYATLSYRTPPGAPPAGEVIPWVGDEEFTPNAMRIFALHSCQVTVTFGPEPIRDGDRKQLATLLREAMEKIFQPTQ